MSCLSALLPLHSLEWLCTLLVRARAACVGRASGHVLHREADASLAPSLCCYGYGCVGIAAIPLITRCMKRRDPISFPRVVSISLQLPLP